MGRAPGCWIRRARPDPPAARTGEPCGSWAAVSRVEDHVKATRRRGRLGVRFEPVDKHAIEVMTRDHASASVETIAVRSSASKEGLGVRQAQVVEDDEHGALLGRQAAEAVLQLVTHRDLGLQVAASASGITIRISTTSRRQPPGRHPQAVIGNAKRGARAKLSPSQGMGRASGSESRHPVGWMLPRHPPARSWSTTYHRRGCHGSRSGFEGRLRPQEAVVEAGG